VSSTSRTEPGAPDSRRVLHLIRAKEREALCAPAPGDRVVQIGDTPPAELVALVFELDAVIVW